MDVWFISDPKIAQILQNERTSLKRLRKYLFLFSGYRTDGTLYLWDLVILARKIAIASILVFARDQLVLQIFFSLLVFVAALILHLVFKPFDDDYAREKKMRVLPSTLEFISIIATIFTLMAGLLFYFQDSVLNEFSAWVLDWALLIINCAVLAAFLLLLFDSLRMKMMEQSSSFVERQLHSRESRRAARWWKRHAGFGCFGWGVSLTMSNAQNGPSSSSLGSKKQENMTMTTDDIEMDVMRGTDVSDTLVAMTTAEQQTGTIAPAVSTSNVNESASPSSPSSPSEPPLPDGWAEVTDPASGRVYYVNRGKRITQWARPSQAPSPSDASASTSTAL